MERNFRLKVELNSSIKFYAVVPSNASINVLKKKISTILAKNYNLPLSNYTIRSLDGYDILDYYSIRDVLEDGQAIILDPFTPAILCGKLSLASPMKESLSLKISDEKKSCGPTEKTDKANQILSKAVVKTIQEKKPVVVDSNTGNKVISTMKSEKTFRPSKDEQSIPAKRSKLTEGPRIVLEKSQDVPITPIIETIISSVKESILPTPTDEIQVSPIKPDLSDADGQSEVVNLNSKPETTVDLKSKPKKTRAQKKEIASETEIFKILDKPDLTNLNVPETTDISSFKPLKKRRPAEDYSFEL